MTNNKYKILLVEDETNIRSMMTTMLGAADYQVIPAETCALAKTLFASYRPDLVLLDLGLPDMGGASGISDPHYCAVRPLRRARQSLGSGCRRQ